MLRVAMHDFISLNVAEIVFQNLLPKQVYERLNVLCHFVHILTLGELTKVNLREGSLEKLDVELIAI